MKDEKVQNRSFKIRCKKCAHVIVVRSEDIHQSKQQSTPEAEPAAASPTPSASASNTMGISQWYAVIQDQQTGPFTTQQLHDFVSQG
jgi:hypothetical protein